MVVKWVIIWKVVCWYLVKEECCLICLIVKALRRWIGNVVGFGVGIVLSYEGLRDVFKQLFLLL